MNELLPTDLNELTVEHVSALETWYYPQSFDGLTSHNGLEPMKLSEALEHYHAGIEWISYGDYVENELLELED